MPRPSILALLFALLLAAGATAHASAGTPAKSASRMDPARVMVESDAAQRVFTGVRRLLEREHPGWDRQTVRGMLAELRGDPLAAAGMVRAKEMLGGRSPLRVGLTLVVLIVGIGTLQALVMRRRFLSIAEGAERIFARRVPSSLASLSAAALGAILPAILPFAVLLALSIARAARPTESMLLAAVADFAWIWTVATLLLAGMREALGRRVLGCPQGPARYLVSGVRWLVIFSIGAVGFLYIGERTGAPPDRLKLLWFLYQTILLVLAAAILLRKSAVMSVFPDLPRPWYRRFVRFFSAAYYPVLLFSLGVAVLDLAGWRALGDFVWRRTWVAAGLFLGLVAFDQFAVGAVRASLRKGESDASLPAGRTPARALERALTSVIRLGEAVFFATTFVRLFEADGPVVQLAMTSMITLGGQEISLWLILQAIAVIAAAILGSRLVGAFLEYKLYPAVGMDPGAGSALNAGITCLSLVVATLVAMRLVGIDLKAVAIFTGALGVGVGFGLQHVVNNLVSGLTLIFGRALKPGDWVTVESQRGCIEEVGMRSTRIRSRDNVEFFVPNATMLQTTIANWTHDDPRARVAARYLVDSRADVGRVREILLRVAGSTPGVLARPEPDVQFPEMGEKGLVFDLLVWIDFSKTSEGGVRSDLNYRVWEEFRRAGIEIPVQEIDVRVVPREPAAPTPNPAK